jgi:ABC-type sugar transport system ATPase subunit
MKEGKVEQVGAPLEVYRNPANLFVASFLASPPMNLLKGYLVLTEQGLQVKVGTLQCCIPDAYRVAYAPYQAQTVIVGLRAEDFHESEERAGPYAIAVNLEVITVEALGPETILVTRLPGTEIDISVRVDIDFSVTMGMGVRLYYDASKIHLFDVISEKVIVRPHLEKKAAAQRLVSL